MPNQPAEAYYCKKYLINCFVHPLVASLFTTWTQVRKYENWHSLEDSVNPQIILGAIQAIVLEHKSFYDNPDHQ